MLSFIVPAYNEERLLPYTLHALHEAGSAMGEPYEIIVSDDGSTDRTAPVAKAGGAQVLQVHHRQIAATRNAGAQVARGDRFIFVDADTVVTREAVAAAVRVLRHGAVGGGCTFRFDGWVPFYGRCLQWTFIRLCRLLGFASGCFLFCTREAFMAVGGFDETLFYAEELAFSRALKHQGRFVVLRETVLTSGRKLRTYSGREILSGVCGLIVNRSQDIRQTQRLAFFYGERRVDPHIPDHHDFGVERET